MTAKQEQPAAGPPQGGLAPLGASDRRSGEACGQQQARLAEVLEDAQKWVRGEKTISQVISDFKARLQRAPA